MTDIETTGMGETSRTDQARQMIGQAGQTLKQEAQSFAGVAQERVRAEAQRGARTAGKTLGDFANAVRRAGDELAATDQSPASRLVRQAADGLETLSRNLADKQPEDLLNSVRDFGRRNPVAFIGGAVLVGLALGRFVRASESGPASAHPLSEESLTFAEDDMFDHARAGTEDVGIDRPLAENLGGLEGSNPTTSASPPMDEGATRSTGAEPPPPRSGGA